MDLARPVAAVHRGLAGFKKMYKRVMLNSVGFIIAIDLYMHKLGS